MDQDDTPGGMTGLPGKVTAIMQQVDPSELAMPLGGYVPGEGSEKAPDVPASLTTGTAEVSKFEFQFIVSGKQYKAVVTHNSITGYDASLMKWTGNGWSPSTSPMKRHILSAFIVHQAINDAAMNALENGEVKLSEPPHTGKPKQPVTG
jgi:hypothetical protein